MPNSLKLAQDARLCPPDWLDDLVGDPLVSERSGLRLAVSRGPGAMLVEAACDDAESLKASDFERCVSSAYTAICDELAASETPCAIRFWNFLPSIHRPMDRGRDRYMVFNAGRAAGLARWAGGRDRLSASAPAASAVGHDGAWMGVYGLAVSTPARMIENPRQVPSYRYSAAFGPVPPCFARATLALLPGHTRPTLLIAGTASIRGEKSVHIGDIAAQFDETVINLNAVLESAGFASDALTRVRLYHPRPQDDGWLESRCHQTFPPEVRLQLVRADLCRADLLLEIEAEARP